MIILGLIFLTMTITVVFLHTGYPGSIKYLGWKMTGVWASPSHNLHVLMYINGPLLKGHAVWSGSQPAGRKIVGSLVLKSLKLKTFWRWSAGTFVEPVTNTELPLRMRLKDKKTLSVQFLGDARMEEWKLIDPL